MVWTLPAPLTRGGGGRMQTAGKPTKILNVCHTNPGVSNKMVGHMEQWLGCWVEPTCMGMPTRTERSWRPPVAPGCRSPAKQIEHRTFPLCCTLRQLLPMPPPPCQRCRGTKKNGHFQGPPKRCHGTRHHSSRLLKSIASGPKNGILGGHNCRHHTTPAQRWHRN